MTTSDPAPRSPERRIVALSVVMSVCFGPLGLAVGGISFLGGSSESPARWLVLTAWFAVYGLAMGLAIAFAWRVENPAIIAERRRRQKEQYWIGDWNSLLDEQPTTGTFQAAGEEPSPPAAPR